MTSIHVAEKRVAAIDLLEHAVANSRTSANGSRMHKEELLSKLLLNTQKFEHLSVPKDFVSRQLVQKLLKVAYEYINI